VQRLRCVAFFGIKLIQTKHAHRRPSKAFIVGTLFLSGLRPPDTEIMDLVLLQQQRQQIDERVVMSSDEEVKDTADDFPIKKTRRKDTRQHVEDDRNNDRDFGGMNEDAFNGDNCSLGGKGEIIDMSSSNKSKPLTDLGGRKKALDDIRRRRQERHQQEQQTPPVQRENPTQTQSDDDDGDTTEPEDSLDVTAEIPNLFSKRSSLLTSARAGGGKRRKNMTNDSYNSDNDESDGEQEPRMMYGDTKLEFTQDGYSD